MAFDEAFETSVGVPQFVQNTQDRIRHNNLPVHIHISYIVALDSCILLDMVVS